MVFFSKGFIGKNRKGGWRTPRMKHGLNWLQILIECRDKIQEEILPILKTTGQPQPFLGIGAGGDPIRRVDLTAEEAIVDTIRRHRVSFTLISEESGLQEYGKNPRECYVTTDPIDGSTNLVRGVPFYATSIAVGTKPTLRSIHSALVTDLVHGATYTAQRGDGSRRNNQRITPSGNTSLEEAVIGIDLNNYRARKVVSELTSLIERTKHIRHFGANALELCYVADGTTDAFIDVRGKLRSTDMAAAWLIVEESGAVMTMPDGKPLNIKLDPKQRVEFLAAGNQKMHERILRAMRHRKDTR
jgi:myo-inositol-1(or 4)-monophosphatase